MLRARALSISFFTLGTMGTQRGRTPQLSFMRSSTRSAVVLGSTVTDLSSGFGGSFTLSHSVVMSPAPAGRAARNITAAISAAQSFSAARFMAILLTQAIWTGGRAPGAILCRERSRGKPRALSPSSLLRLLEVTQIRRRLVLSGRHQPAVGVPIIGLIADLDPIVVHRAILRPPDRTWLFGADGLLDLGIWPRQCMIDHGHRVIERVAVGLVEIKPLLDDG